MYELIVSDDAAGDLERLLLEKRTVAIRIIALLEQLSCDQDLLDRLTQDGYGGSPKRPVRGAVINIGKWISAQKKGLNLWRMRDFELSRQGHEYRVIYAYNPSKEQYLVLAVVERDFDYDESHSITQRIFATYNRLDDDQW